MDVTSDRLPNHCCRPQIWSFLAAVASSNSVIHPTTKQNESGFAKHNNELEKFKWPPKSPDADFLVPKTREHLEGPGGVRAALSANVGPPQHRACGHDARTAQSLPLKIWNCGQTEQIFPRVWFRWSGWLRHFPTWFFWCCSSAGPLYQVPGGVWFSTLNLIGRSYSARQYVGTLTLSIPFLLPLAYALIIVPSPQPKGMDRCSGTDLFLSGSWFRGSPCLCQLQSISQQLLQVRI